MALLRQRGLPTVYGLAFALAGWVIGLAPLRDNSLFWHLRTGELILEDGIPRADPYSYTAAGSSWTAQSWLVELLYGVLDRAIGPFGVRLLVATVAATTAVLAFAVAYLLARDGLRAAGLAIVALAGVVVSFSGRPLLAGVLLLLVLVWVVELPDRWLGRHEVIAVPAVLWIWCNVHGTWVLGFAYLALHLLGRWCEGSPPWSGRERRLLAGSAIGSAVVFVNPYGWRMVTFPVALLGRGEQLRQLREWASPDLASPVGVALAAWLVVFLVVIGRHGISRRDLVVAIPFTVLAFVASRNAAIAPLVTLPILARAVAVPSERGAHERAMPSWFLVALVVIMVGGGVVAAAGGSREADFDVGRYPVAALEAVESPAADGRLLTTDRVAGYVILELWPEERVFIDDRIDMYPEAVVDAYLTLFDGTPGWSEVLDEHGIDRIVWPMDAPLTALLEEASAWERVYDDLDDGAWVRVGRSRSGDED